MNVHLLFSKRSFKCFFILLAFNLILQLLLSSFTVLKLTTEQNSTAQHKRKWKKERKKKNLACNTTIFMLNLMRWSLKMQCMLKLPLDLYVYVCVCLSFCFVALACVIADLVTKQSDNKLLKLKTFNAFQCLQQTLFAILACNKSFIYIQTH